MNNEISKPSIKWHKLELGEIFKKLNSGKEGLSDSQAKSFLEKFGANALPVTKLPSHFLIFLRQFKGPLIYVLLIASIIVFIMGNTIDGLVILAVLLINAIIGTIQEGKAQDKLAALKQITETEATVVRSGREKIIKDIGVVKGDIILLKAGDTIPTDSRLIEADSLIVDESSLTGESKSVSKNTEAILEENTTIAEQANMVFKGTYVLSGTARSIAVSTGIETVIGKIAVKLESLDSEVPLRKSIRLLSRAIIFAIFLIISILFLVGVSYGISQREMFAISVAIAVSAIPEGLPVVVTLILATGVWRMSNKNALVKRLQAVEALGQVQVIAVDKTGTITKNQMMASWLYSNGIFFEITGDGYEPEGTIKSEEGSLISPQDHPEILLSGRISSLTATASIAYSEENKEWKRISGDPTEVALLVFARKLGYSKIELESENPRISEIPFKTHLKYHATVNKTDGKNVFSIAGAPEAVLWHCESLWKDGKSKIMSKEDKRELGDALKKMSSQGLRVIALAVKFNSEAKVTPENMPKLTFVGFVGISDVIRDEVEDAVQQAKRAGIKVVMITGDYKDTAEAIAKKVGIFEAGDLILTGNDIEDLEIEELKDKLNNVTVFARVSPEHKLKIIEAYKARKEIIAMTGDGVNDALSLVAADLGVAMGKTGTEVAKRAADIILLDDNFGSIIFAVEEGRNIYRSIKKVILYLFSTGVGEILAISGAILVGFPIPLFASQIIWLNLVTDGFLVVALGMEPREKNLLEKRFKKPSKWFVDSTMLVRIFLVGFTMMFASLYLFKDYFELDLIKASTIALTVLAVTQWFNVWNVKSEKKSIFATKWLDNKYLAWSTLIVVLLHIMIIYFPPMQKIFHTTALSLYEWGIIIGVSLSVIVVEEIRKFIYRFFSKG